MNRGAGKWEGGKRLSDEAVSEDYGVGRQRRGEWVAGKERVGECLNEAGLAQSGRIIK